MMDASVLNAPADTIPPEVDALTWLRYVKGAKAFDELWGKGKRCPNNDGGVRCKCQTPTKSDYCAYFVGLETLVKEIGGATLTMMKGMR